MIACIAYLIITHININPPIVVKTSSSYGIETDKILEAIKADPNKLDSILIEKIEIKNKTPINIVIKDTQIKIKHLITMPNLSIDDSNLIYRLNLIQNHIIDIILKDEEYPEIYNKSIYVINNKIDEIIKKSKYKTSPSPSLEYEGIELTVYKDSTQQIDSKVSPQRK